MCMKRAYHKNRYTIDLCSEDFNELPILSIGDETLKAPLNETKQNTDQQSQLDPALSKQSNAKLKNPHLMITI